MMDVDNEQHIHQVHDTNKEWNEFALKHFTEYKNIILESDPCLDYTFFLGKNYLYLLNTNTFEQIQKFKIPNNWKNIDSSRLLTFLSNDAKYLIVYNNNHLLITLITKTANEQFLEMRMDFLRENESLVKVYFMKNEVN
jgi:hypothetical protein